MAPSGPAKRKVLRPPMRIECAREGDLGTHFLGYAANLSETGVFVQSLVPRPAGTRPKARRRIAPSVSDRPRSSMSQRKLDVGCVISQ